MKKYLLVALKMSVSDEEGAIFGDMSAIKRVFMWHKNTITKKTEVYAFHKNKNAFFDSLVEAQQAAQSRLNQVLYPKIKRSIAILEVDCEKSEVVEFCNLYSINNGKWSSAKIEFESLTSSAWDDVSSLYQDTVEILCSFG